MGGLNSYNFLGPPKLGAGADPPGRDLLLVHGSDR